MLVLSALPIGEQQVVALSKRMEADDPFERTLLSVNVGGLHIVNAHLSWVAEQAADNVRETIAHIKTIEGDMLLIGDFNQEPSNEAMLMLGKEGLVDGWATCCHGQPGRTYPADAPAARIDYLMVRGSTPRFANMRLVGDGGEFSDHLGIVADVVR